MRYDNPDHWNHDNYQKAVTRITALLITNVLWYPCSSFFNDNSPLFLIIIGMIVLFVGIFIVVFGILNLNKIVVFSTLAIFEMISSAVEFLQGY